MKRSLLTMMGKVGVVGVLELISEVAEETVDSFLNPPPGIDAAKNPESSFYVNFWQLTAAHTKELSEKLLHETRKTS